METKNIAKKSTIQKIEKLNSLELELNEENSKKFSDFQKKNGGVIRIPNIPLAKKYFKKLGYKIISLTQDEILKNTKINNDITNFNKDVDYVVCIIESKSKSSNVKKKIKSKYNTKK